MTNMTATDAWKGEHLIRGMKPAHRGGSYAIAKKINKQTAPRKKPKQKNKPAVLCNVPGCNEKLTYRNMSMVCRDHLHGDFCRCKRCVA